MMTLRITPLDLTPETLRPKLTDSEIAQVPETKEDGAERRVCHDRSSPQRENGCLTLVSGWYLFVYECKPRRAQMLAAAALLWLTIVLIEKKRGDKHGKD